MKVFDFDNTLYHGESAVDLALYMIKNNKKIILYLPKIFINLIKYKLCLVDKKKIVAAINDFLNNVTNNQSIPTLPCRCRQSSRQRSWKYAYHSEKTP